MAFNPKDLGQYKQFLDTQSKISKVMSQSSKDFAIGIKDAAVAQRDLNKAQKQYDKLKKEELTLEKQIQELEKRKDAESQKQLKLLRERLKLVKEEKQETKKVLDQQKALASALKSQVASVKNLTLAVGRDLFKAGAKVVKKFGELNKEFTSIDDSMRRTAINIGVVGKQMTVLRRNAYKAALVTQRFGVDAKELVQMYGTYADEVGRLVPITQSGMVAMARLSKMTSLGSDGAASFAANMEAMGMSVEATTAYVDDINKMSKKIGVNSGKTIKLLASNLLKAQTVHFKGGAKGMAEMAASAVALRGDMAATLSLAQDLWEPEKAIETAASLQMMGGAFARMADPLKLMFDARNNPAKLMEDIGKAAAQSVKLQDGVYTISSLEMTRLKEVAKVTGYSLENVVQMAKTAAKQQDVGKLLDPRIKGPAREMIENMSKWEGGKLVIETSKGTMQVANITKDVAKDLRDQAKETEKREEAAQSFMTRMKQMWDSLKNLAMRFFMGMEEGLRPILDALTGTGGMQRLGDKMEELGKSVGNWIATVGVPFIQGAIPLIKEAIGKLTVMVGNTSKWINEKLIPVTKEVIAFMKGWWKENGTFIEGLLGAALGLSKAVWKFLKFLGPKGALAAILLVKFPAILRTVIGGLRTMLGGMGSMFGSRGTWGNPMVVTSMGGGVGGVGGGRMPMINRMGGRIAPMGRGGRLLKSMGGLFGGRNTMVGRMFRGGAARTMGYTGGFMRGGGASMLGGLGKTVGGRGGASMLGGMGARLSRGLAAGGPLALLGLGAQVGRMFMDDPDTTMGKTLGVLGTTASDAAMGMMIGSMLGPLGTAIGGIIGGIVGFGRSMYREITTKGKSDFDMGGAKSKLSSNKLSISSSSYMGDGQIAPGGAVITSSKGTFFTDKKDYITASTVNPLAPRKAETMSVNIGGTISLAGGGSSVSLDGLIKDPVFVAEMTKAIIKQTENQNK